MEVKATLELLGDAMKYVVFQNRLLEAIMMKWEDAKMSKLEYYIANSNLKVTLVVHTHITWVFARLTF